MAVRFTGQGSFVGGTPRVPGRSVRVFFQDAQQGGQSTARSRCSRSRLRPFTRLERRKSLGRAMEPFAMLRRTSQQRCPGRPISFPLMTWPCNTIERRQLDPVVLEIGGRPCRGRRLLRKAAPLAVPVHHRVTRWATIGRRSPPPRRTDAGRRSWACRWNRHSRSGPPEDRGDWRRRRCRGSARRAPAG